MKKIVQQILRVMPILFWISMAIVTVLMLITLSPPKIKFEYIDKVEHAFVFMILTGLAILAWPQHKRTIFIGLATFGGLMELAQQAFTSYRQASFGDWAADIFGVLIALIIGAYITKRRSILTK